MRNVCSLVLRKLIKKSSKISKRLRAFYNFVTITLRLFSSEKLGLELSLLLYFLLKETESGSHNYEIILVSKNLIRYLTGEY